jgi:hypothetical protein
MEKVTNTPGKFLTRVICLKYVSCLCSRLVNFLRVVKKNNGM